MTSQTDENHMRAVILSGHGDESVLQYVRQHPRPTIGANQVLVKVHACAVSFSDIKSRQGTHLDPLSSFVQAGNIIGYEISGCIEELGNEVTGFDVGDDVVALSPLDNPVGGYAEYSVQYAYNVVRKPAHISHVDAAAVLQSGIVAIQAIHYHAKLVSGESLLIVPSNKGGDVSVVIQLAVLLGVSVFVVADTDGEIEDYQSIAGGQVSVIDLRRSSLVDTLSRELNGVGTDAVLDLRAAPHEGWMSVRDDDIAGEINGGMWEAKTVESISQQTLIECLATHGRLMVCHTAVQIDPPDAAALFVKGASVSFLCEQLWPLSTSQQGRYLHILSDITEKLALEAVKPKIAGTYSLDKARMAHQQLLNGKTNGRIVLKIV
eukprot:GFYU01007539.1.p1 GENE.GFYU01007539.1~~GFYU01007539.1.p1  ORF type:complete len:377 (+),score=90.17 GFYU01007539.1:110-1240(+)